MTQGQADLLGWLTLAGLTAAGILHPSSVEWYKNLAWLAALLVPGCFVAGVAFDYISSLLASPSPGHRLQHDKTEPPMYAREGWETAVCMYVVATITAWPVTQVTTGRSHPFKETLEEASVGTGAVAVAFYAAKIFGCIVFADAWTYFKHRSLHHPSLYAIHKSHHCHHNPSSWASFAVHPVEALLTFLPIAVMTSDWGGWLTLYLPFHLPFMVGLGLLNLYLHCGYSIPALEAVLKPLYVNSSEYHHLHHRLQRTHYAEVLTVWDHVLGTHTGSWSKDELTAVSRRIQAGKGEQDGE